MIIEPKTEKGRETRIKIVKAAAELMHVRGIQATSVDDVLTISGTGKSQFYSHFRSKDDLVHAVLEFQSRVWLDRAEPVFADLNSIEGFDQWFRRILSRHNKLGFIGGCPVGSMAAEMSDNSPSLRKDLASVFSARRRLIRKAVLTMKTNGTLRPDADEGELARFILAAIQGGLLLSSTEKSANSLRASLEAALAHLKTFAVAKTV